MNKATVRRWAPWLALVVVFAIATSALSWWQFDRRNQRVDRINQVVANYDLSPQPFDQIDWSINPDGKSDQEWTPAIVTGEYLPQEAMLVRNRPLNGQAGFLQLVPLRLASGEILIVERGWLIASSDLTEPASNPLPQPGTHELVVRLRVGEPDLGREEAATLASIDLTEVASRLSRLGPVITDRYGRVVTEQPSYPEAPLGMPKPSLDEGNHLSYAIQWIIFGIMAFVAFFWAYRNDRRLLREAAGLAQPKLKRKTRADLDAEFEDANQ